jgi:hypothetical protein
VILPAFNICVSAFLTKISLYLLRLMFTKWWIFKVSDVMLSVVDIPTRCGASNLVKTGSCDIFVPELTGGMVIHTAPPFAINKIDPSWTHRIMQKNPKNSKHLDRFCLNHC